MKCLICFKDEYFVSENIILTDGNFVHKSCYEVLLNDIKKGDNNLNLIEDEIKQIENEIPIRRKILNTYTENDIASKISNFFFGKNKVLASHESESFSKLHKLLSLLKTKQASREATRINWNRTKLHIENMLKSIYDYWPTYPPDWNIRKIDIRSLGYCSDCLISWEKNTAANKKNRKFGDELLSLQVHHIKPLKDGGSNKKENLKLLCNKCHEKTHGFSFSYDNKSVNLKSNFTEKIDLIHLALKENKCLRFTYKDFEGKLSKRTVIPNSITDKLVGKSNKLGNKYLIGFCETRKEIRTFNISNISSLSIE